MMEISNVHLNKKKLSVTTGILTPEPLVSVIIPCFNQGVFLGEAIESVKKQTYPCVEIIVVDDGSRDETKIVARQYPDVFYFFQQNSGLPAARNKGMEKSQGDYLVFLDADDLLLNDAISYNVRQLQNDRDAVFVSGAYDVVSRDKQIIADKAETVDSDH